MQYAWAGAWETVYNQYPGGGDTGSGLYFEKQGCKQPDVLLAFPPPLHLQTRTKIVTQGKRQFLAQEAGCSVDCKVWQSGAGGRGLQWRACLLSGFP